MKNFILVFALLTASCAGADLRYAGGAAPLNCDALLGMPAEYQACKIRLMERGAACTTRPVIKAGAARITPDGRRKEVPFTACRGAGKDRICHEYVSGCPHVTAERRLYRYLGAAAVGFIAGLLVGL